MSKKDLWPDKCYDLLSTFSEELKREVNTFQSARMQGSEDGPLTQGDARWAAVAIGLLVSGGLEHDAFVKLMVKMKEVVKK